VSALQLAITHRVDRIDAVLLHLARQQAAGFLAAEDLRLGHICAQLGITP
jgi:hypothetical protein